MEKTKEQKAYDEGRTDAAMHQAATEQYNQGPTWNPTWDPSIERYNHGPAWDPTFDPLPWPKGSPLYEAYHRGWEDWFHKTEWR